LAKLCPRAVGHGPDIAERTPGGKVSIDKFDGLIVLTQFLFKLILISLILDKIHQLGALPILLKAFPHQILIIKLPLLGPNTLAITPLFPNLLRNKSRTSG
jgi:hypothetical protein